MKKFLKNIQILALAGVIAALSSCGCPEFNTEPNPDPSVREATITEFNPDFTTPTNIGGDTIATPVDQYSIHTFLFPNNVSSSGSLPNDTRVAGGKEIVLAETKYDRTVNNATEQITAQLVVNRPTNDTLVGDIMVSFVEPNGAAPARFARLRFYGSLGKYIDPLNSASAKDFANYLIQKKSETEGFSGGSGVTRYGLDAPRVNSTTGNVTIFRAVRPNGDTIPTSEIPANIQAELISKTDNESYVEIEVRIGEVYYYRARNGIEFGVLIEDIRQGSIAPNLNRVTIKFAELKGPSCEP
jgi:hypothetical protein